MQRALARDDGVSETSRQCTLRAGSDAALDGLYAEAPRCYDASPHFLEGCHQTPNFGSTACHWDKCNPGLETAHGVVTGRPSTCMQLELAPCGTVQPPVRSAVIYPVQKLGSLLALGDFELHDCRIPIAMHGSVAAPNRGVHVRGLGMIDGGVICDHDDLQKGSAEWHAYNVRHRRMSARESRAAARLPGGLNTFFRNNPGRRVVRSR